jgi:hypothetical protein
LVVVLPQLLLLLLVELVVLQQRLGHHECRKRSETFGITPDQVDPIVLSLRIHHP